MFKKMSLIALAAAGFSATAGAASYVDTYYVPSAKLEATVPGFGSAEVDGDGFGVKGAFGFSDQMAFTGEYHTVEYDDNAGELDQVRLGLGFGSGVLSQGLYGVAEFIQIDSGSNSDAENGFGLHGGYTVMPAENLSLKGQIGYVDIADGDGIEFLVGGAFNLTPAAAAFLDYRLTSLEDDSSTEVDLKDLRLGVRFTF